jgi:hypothetical protein
VYRRTKAEGSAEDAPFRAVTAFTLGSGPTRVEEDDDQGDDTEGREKEVEHVEGGQRVLLPSQERRGAEA